MTRRCCCGDCGERRLCWEFRQPFFTLQEHNGKGYIDIRSAFVRFDDSKKAVAIFLRFIMLSWPISILVLDLVKNYSPENRFIYMAYLTHWGLVISIAALLSTLLCTVFSKRALEQPPPGQPATLAARTAWFLLSIGIPTEVMITILYWTLEYRGNEITYINVMSHGGVCILLLLDGFVIGNVPFRAKQLIFSVVLPLVFCIWVAIHSYSGIGDGDWPWEPSSDPDFNDDALYPVLDYQTDPVKAAVLSIVITFGFAPILFLLIWSFSLWSVRGCKLDGSSRKMHDYTEGAGNYARDQNDKTMQEP